MSRMYENHQKRKENIQFWGLWWHYRGTERRQLPHSKTNHRYQYNMSPRGEGEGGEGNGGVRRGGGEGRTRPSASRHSLISSMPILIASRVPPAQVQGPGSSRGGPCGGLFVGPGVGKSRIWGVPGGHPGGVLEPLGGVSGRPWCRVVPMLLPKPMNG